jgi:uncharacterized protein YbaP (TraB family)
MRRKIITLFVALVVVLLAPAAYADNRGALYKVQAGGHTLYLFGTMHVGLPEFFPLEPGIEQAIATAKSVSLEIDPAQDPALVQQAMIRFGLQPAGKRSDDGMPDADRERLARALKQAGIDQSNVAAMKPWLLATMLSLYEYTAQGYRADLSVDNYVAAQARKAKVPVRELESVAAQLALFDSLTPAEQRTFLLETLDAMDSGKQATEVKEVVNAWRTADKAALDDIARRAEEDQSVSGRFLQKVLIEGRNGALADKIAAQLARDSGSVSAIGVLHLVGPKGVPALLQARGMTVERVY